MEKKLIRQMTKKFEKQYGPFLPGNQVFQSDYKNDYVKLSREEKGCTYETKPI